MIEVEHLKKYYSVFRREPGLRNSLKALFRRQKTEVRAVDGLSFHIAEGKRVGFLGPNGAGKTTTLKMLSGLLYPSSGKVLVDGHLPHKRETDFLKKIILVMGQKQQLLWDLPPLETLELNRAIYEVQKPVFRKRLEALTELLDIGPQLRTPARQLSLGERMKCELAAGLIHSPKLLFLDEPTIGLDVSMQQTIREFIRSYNEKEGATLILTSHNMDDVEALCPRILVIDKGRLLFDGSVAELVAQVKPEKRIGLRFEDNKLPENLEAYGRVVSTGVGEATLQLNREEVSGVLGQLLARFAIKDLTVENPPLEEVMGELFSKHAFLRHEEGTEST
ncbi:MAG: ATP-binding cassette domain-containing protein [Proteobacteria bacterium]|nr:ATP-binding cassette domain-containing protein [Cystobacterineae bacterium]MCL2258384.1 ATP-binding cassette domain-containing protein [Cystobacterineae bacterium]MCL2315104.1 ATP-binding cassette domain-containing protein [Pseudomonadota bacterium]